MLNGNISKGHWDRLEGAPTCQIWDNLSIKKNSDGNELWHRDFLKRIHEVCSDSQKKEKQKFFFPEEYQLKNTEGILE